MAVIQKNTPIVIKYNTDTLGNLQNLKIKNEQHKVVNSQFTLQQVPDIYDKVQFVNRTMFELAEDEKINTSNEFKVNYTNGHVTVHPSLEGQDVTVNYSGRGVVLTPASRIYDDSNGEPINTTKMLSDYISNVKNSLYKMKGEFSYEVGYQEKDLVHFGIEKSLYECIKPTIPGISPLNTEYWNKSIDTKEMFDTINNYNNDITGLYVAYDMGIVLNHNLNDYPSVTCLATTTYGHGGFGIFSFSDSSMYEVKTRCEYIDMNSISVYLDEKFNGTPIITRIDDRHFDVTFSDEGTTLKMILK